MIVGNGDIATVLKEARLPAQEKYLFFASGVSNSREESYSEFSRELQLLLKQNRAKHVVYFSSLAVFYGKTPYVDHKIGMETIVREFFKSYTIIRIGNITWGSNPNTLINHFRNLRKEGKPLDIQDVYRYIVDKDEFLHWIDLIPEWNCEMNITGRRLKVKEIVKEYANA